MVETNAHKLHTRSYTVLNSILKIMKVFIPLQGRVPVVTCTPCATSFLLGPYEGFDHSSSFSIILPVGFGHMASLMIHHVQHSHDTFHKTVEREWGQTGSSIIDSVRSLQIINRGMLKKEILKIKPNKDHIIGASLFMRTMTIGRPDIFSRNQVLVNHMSNDP